MTEQVEIIAQNFRVLNVTLSKDRDFGYENAVKIRLEKDVFIILHKDNGILEMVVRRHAFEDEYIADTTTPGTFLRQVKHAIYAIQY